MANFLEVHPNTACSMIGSATLSAASSRRAVLRLLAGEYGSTFFTILS